MVCRRPEGRARCGERGSAALEAAVAIPLVLLLVLGMAHLGVLLKTYASTANAVRAGGRVASVAGADPLADRRILERIAQESAGISASQIDLVVIWHAEGPGEHVPDACIPADLSQHNTTSLGISDGGTDALGACNVYVRPADAGAGFDMARGRAPLPAEHYFGCQGASDPLAIHKVDCRWPGKNRRAVTSPRSSPEPAVGPDFVGVHIRLRHHISDIAFDEVTITDTVIHLIEPQEYEV